MDQCIKLEDFLWTGKLYSYLGKLVLAGNVDAVKALYGYAWREHPALIKTITLLQECLTAVEIENDDGGVYCDEFLYYWSMICIGEQSTLILKDLGTAEMGFKKIVKTTPQAKARLAFKEMLRSDEPAKSDRNIRNLDVLREWAGKQDLFSRIILSKIVFYQFLNEDEIDNAELPMKVWRLLELPCQKRHPVAVRFWNAVLDHMEISSERDMRIGESSLDANILYDFHLTANMQLGRKNA